jgi:hypothetical protein
MLKVLERVACPECLLLDLVFCRARRGRYAHAKFVIALGFALRAGGLVADAAVGVLVVCRMGAGAIGFQGVRAADLRVRRALANWRGAGGVEVVWAADLRVGLADAYRWGAAASAGAGGPRVGACAGPAAAAAVGTTSPSAAAVTSAVLG